MKLLNLIFRGVDFTEENEARFALGIALALVCVVTSFPLPTTSMISDDPIAFFLKMVCIVGSFVWLAIIVVYWIATCWLRD